MNYKGLDIVVASYVSQETVDEYTPLLEAVGFEVTIDLALPYICVDSVAKKVFSRDTLHESDVRQYSDVFIKKIIADAEKTLLEETVPEPISVEAIDIVLDDIELDNLEIDPDSINAESETPIEADLYSLEPIDPFDKTFTIAEGDGFKLSIQTNSVIDVILKKNRVDASIS